MTNRALGAVAALLLLFSLGVGIYVYMGSVPSSSQGSQAGFDLGGEEAAAIASAEPAAPPPARVEQSPKPVIGYAVDDDAEEEPEDSQVAAIPSSGNASKVGAAIAAVPGAAAALAKGETTPAAQRAREKDFLAKHGKALAQYHGKLNDIAMRYYKANPVVRDVDKAFANMGAYMTVKRRFDKDGDPFSFARDAIALPEVRAEIAKRMADPKVWGAALGMITEALKQPPPDALYKEAQNFLVADDKVSTYIAGFSQEVAKNVPALVQGIPPGSDLSGLKKVVADVSPGSLPP